MHAANLTAFIFWNTDYIT